MNIWRKGYNRVLYQPVVVIHGIFYTVKDEVVFKRHECEWIVSEAVARHFKYNPRNLPVVINDDNSVDYLLALSILRILRGYVASREVTVE